MGGSPPRWLATYWLQHGKQRIRSVEILQNVFRGASYHEPHSIRNLARRRGIPLMA